MSMNDVNPHLVVARNHSIDSNGSEVSEYNQNNETAGNFIVGPNRNNNNDNNNVNGPADQPLQNALDSQNVKNLIKDVVKSGKTGRLNKLADQLAGKASQSASHANSKSVDAADATAIEDNLKRLDEKDVKNRMQKALSVSSTKRGINWTKIDSKHDFFSLKGDKSARMATAANVRQMIREAVLNTFAKTGDMDAAEDVKKTMLELLKKPDGGLTEIYNGKTDTPIQEFAKKISDASINGIERALWSERVYTSFQANQADVNVENNMNQVGQGEENQVEGQVNIPHNENVNNDEGQVQLIEGQVETFDGKDPALDDPNLSDQEKTDLIIAKHLEDNQKAKISVTADGPENQNVVENDNNENVGQDDEIVQTNDGENDGEVDPEVANAMKKFEQQENDGYIAVNLDENRKHLENLTGGVVDNENVNNLIRNDDDVDNIPVNQQDNSEINDAIGVTEGKTPIDDDNESIIDGNETPYQFVLEDQDVDNINLENPKPQLETKKNEILINDDDNEIDYKKMGLRHDPKQKHIIDPDKMPNNALPETQGGEIVTPGDESVNPSPSSKQIIDGKIVFDV
ncbi:MAG: hypothetical protein AAGH74_04110 [Pseudomonadota bacterium]